MKRTAWLACVLCCAVGAARGQVRPIQDGRRLDASFRVGSGGVNTPVPAPNPMNSQLYVTGQVTGLGGFRGRTGYFAADQLRLGLPSASLDRFHSQSVSLNSVLGGGTFQTSPYLSRSRTVFGPGAIVDGRAAPGSNVPRTGVVFAPERRALLNELLSQYRPLASTGVRYVPPVGLSTPRGGLGDPSAAGMPALPGSAIGGAGSRGAASLFAVRPAGTGTGITDPKAGTEGPGTGARGAVVPSAAARTGLADPPGLLPIPVRGATGQPVLPAPGDAAITPIEPARPRMVTPGGPVRLPRRGEAGQARPGDGNSAVRMSDRPGAEPGTRLKRPDRPAAATAVRPKPIARGQDVFIDLMRSLQQSRGGAAGGPQDNVVGSSPKSVAELAPKRPAGPGEKKSVAHLDMSVADWRTGRKRLQYPAPDSEAARSAVAYVELTPEQRVQINALAGAGKDDFNQRMSAGQAKLKAGRYYDAAAEFERASSLDPRNPLARVGVCLALFCAGEPMTSANYLRRAMIEFPPLMDVRVNLHRLVPAHSLRWQIDRLRRRLQVPAEARKPMMVFLACFLEVNLNRPPQAKALAETLKGLPGADELLKAYAARVIKGDTSGGSQTKPSAKPTP